MMARAGLLSIVLVVASARSEPLAAQPGTAPPPDPARASSPASSPSSSPSAPAAPPAEPKASSPAEPSSLLDRLRVGARFGANFASVDTNPDESSAYMKAGMVIGGFATLGLTRFFEVELGLGYSQRGFHLEPVATQSEVAVALDYFEAPALLRARIPWGVTAASIRLMGGASLLVLDAAHSSDNDEMVDIEAQVADVDVALVIGAGLDFTFGSWVVMFDVRHDRGMVDTAKGEAGFEIYNRVTSLQVGASF